MIYDVIIIGGGPAGVATSLQLKKFDISSLLIEKHNIGGLLKNAYRVDNYPGFHKGISGDKLCTLFEKQLISFKCNYIFDDVATINYQNNAWIVNSKNTSYFSKIVVLATGTKAIYPDNISLSNKIVTEYFSLKNITDKKIAVIGSGDAAFDYALSLYSNNNEVNIFSRSDQLKCNQSLYNMFLKTMIILQKNHQLKNIEENNDHINIQFIHNNNLRNYKFDYLVFAIGREPDSYLIENIKIEKFINKNLFLIGDLINGNFRQTSISVGQGVRTAMEINDILKNNQ